MFAALRRLAGRFIVALCVCSILLPATVANHALRNDDIACRSAVSSPDHAPTQIAAVTTPDVSGHCALCHWLRAMGGVVPGEKASALSRPATREIPLARLAWWHDEMLPLDRPSRAPPASTFLL